MMCETCHQKPAAVHYSQVVNGEATELHMCEGCAKEKGMGAFGFGSPGAVSELLKGLAGASFMLPSAKEGEVKNAACQCGMTLGEFQKTGFLGCPECYQTFKQSIAVILKRIHGATEHIGTTPIKQVKGSSGEAAASPASGRPKRPYVSPAEKIKRLKKELAKAIEEERFEEAAAMRDRLKQMNEQSSSPPQPSPIKGEEKKRGEGA